MATTQSDRIHLARLTGVARNLAWRRPGTPQEWATAVEVLRAEADGRSDLLAELAESSIGAGEGQLDRDVYIVMTDLCVAAGADERQIDR